jgi:hypothetical protein
MMADKRQRAMASALMDENLLARLGQGYEAQPYGFTPSRFPRLQMQATTPAEAMNADGIGAFSPELSAGMVPPLAEQRTMPGAVDPGSIYQGSRPSFLANAIDAFRGRQTPSRPSALAQALAAGVPGGETISQFARDVYEGAATNRNGMFAPQPAKPAEPAQNNLVNPDYGAPDPAPPAPQNNLVNPDYGTDEATAVPAAPPLGPPVTIADAPVMAVQDHPEPPRRPPGLGANSISNSPYATNAQQGAFNAMDDRFSAQNFAYSGGGRPQPTQGQPAQSAAAATGRATATASTPVSGKGYDNPQARETYEYALSQGLTPVQAAAYTGAKLAESRFDPNARNPGDGRDGTDSIGTFQWNSGRAQALKQFAAQQGKSWNDPAVQRAFSFAELNGSERAAGQALRNAKTPEEATAAMLSYLRPGGWTSSNPLGAHSAPARLRNTQGILSAFGNLPAVSPGTGAKQVPLTTAQAAQNTARPIAGDDPETLEADARYYEKTNPRAAAEFRARAEIARRKAAPRVAALSQHLRGTA